MLQLSAGAANNGRMDKPLSRELEARLEARCCAVGTGADARATEAREVNVFRVAAGVLRAGSLAGRICSLDM